MTAEHLPVGTRHGHPAVPVLPAQDEQQPGRLRALLAWLRPAARPTVPGPRTGLVWSWCDARKQYVPHLADGDRRSCIPCTRPEMEISHD